VEDKINLQITLIMRFQIDGMTALAVAERWLREHPESTWKKLREQILQNRVIYHSGQLIENPLTQPPESQSQTPADPNSRSGSQTMNYQGALYQPNPPNKSEAPPLPKSPRRVYRGRVY
jgi:hypothetical protein